MSGIEEVKAEIEKLERKRHNLAMCDHWDNEDYALYKKWFDEVQKLEAELKKLGGV